MHLRKLSASSKYDRIDDTAPPPKGKTETKLPSLPEHAVENLLQVGSEHYLKELETLCVESSGKFDFSSVNHEGVCLRISRLDCDTWIEEYGVLKGDQFTCFKDSKKLEVTFESKVGFSVIERSSFANPAEKDPDHALVKDKVMVFGAKRRTVLGFSNLADATGWTTSFARLMEKKYSQDILNQKMEVIHKYHRIWLHQIRSHHITLAQSRPETFEGVGIPTIYFKKIHQSPLVYLPLPLVDNQQQQKINVFGALFFQGVVLNRSSHDIVEAKDKIFTTIPRDFILNCYAENDQLLIITPLMTYRFECTSHVVANDWVIAITSHNEKLPQDLERTEFNLRNDLGFSYSGKPLLTRAFVEELRPDDKPKKFVLKKEETTIGRSGSVDITVPDSYISRCHGKFVIAKNIPYFVDLSGSSFKLNDVSKKGFSPLKPGDRIRIGKTDFIFEVKHSVIFVPPLMDL